MKIKTIDVDTTFPKKIGQDSWYDNYDGVVITFDDDSQFKFGIQNGQNCCENWGYLWSIDDVASFIGAEYLGWEEKNTWPADIEEQNMYEGGFQAIDVKTDRGILQFVVYNDHNGYYSHETLVIEGGEIKDSGYL